MGRYKYIPRGTAGGWIKSQDSPVIGGALGTVFDCCVRKENEGYRMWSVSYTHLDVYKRQPKRKKEF